MRAPGFGARGRAPAPQLRVDRHELLEFDRLPLLWSHISGCLVVPIPGTFPGSLPVPANCTRPLIASFVTDTQTRPCSSILGWSGLVTDTGGSNSPKEAKDPLHSGAAIPLSHPRDQYVPDRHFICITGFVVFTYSRTVMNTRGA